MTVSDLLEQPCNKSDNVIKLVISCCQLVPNLLQQTRNKQCENNLLTTCEQTCNNLCVFTRVNMGLLPGVIVPVFIEFTGRAMLNKFRPAFRIEELVKMHLTYLMRNIWYTGQAFYTLQMKLQCVRCLNHGWIFWGVRGVKSP